MVLGAYAVTTQRLKHLLAPRPERSRSLSELVQPEITSGLKGSLEAVEPALGVLSRASISILE
jgi:hypothetical protein